MNNGQLKPSYNVQIAVESEYIVGVGLFHNPTDTTTLIPFMERIQSNSKRQIRNLIADAGYASEENFTYLEEHEQNAYIKPQLYDFGIIKQDFRFRRFLTKGKAKNNREEHRCIQPFPPVYCIFFQVHGSKFKPDAVSDLGQASVLGAAILSSRCYL